MTTLTDNIARVQQTIMDACARAGRDPTEVKLIAVSKTKPLAEIVQAAEAGLQHFGENRVEELQQKVPSLTLPIIWHMIGHIQSRKARLVPPLVQVVHSLDSVALAEKLSKAAVEHARSIDVLLEVNVSGEASKGGFAGAGWQHNSAVREALVWQVQQILTLPALRVVGLMTMAPIVEDMADARSVFASLAALRVMLREACASPLPELSMGMTDDYPVAIEEGATMIRVGRAIFGERG